MVTLLFDLVRRACRSGSGQQWHWGRGLDEGGVEDDWQGHGRDTHLQRRGERLQDKGRLAQRGGGLRRGRG